MLEGGEPIMINMAIAGKSTSSIGNTSSKGPFSIASYVSFLEGLFFSSNMLKHFEIGNCFFLYLSVSTW